MPKTSTGPRRKTSPPGKKDGKERESFQKPKGTHDILPSEWHWWEKVLGVSKKYCELYGFGRIESPLIENSRLFTKGVGEDTDVVAKEMYIFRTKGGDELALRPEATASIVRAYMEHSLARVNPVQKLWYEGPMFRHERPQSGRYREFHQVGLEILGGTSDPIYDAHIIVAFWKILAELKLKRPILKINS